MADSARRFGYEAVAAMLGAATDVDACVRLARRIDTRSATNLACAFLVDGKCSAYEARLSPCSGYHSLDRVKCEASFNHGGNLPEGIPVLSALGYVATALDQGMEQGLTAASLDATRVELNTALAALIRNPALIQRWRSGRSLKI